MASVYEVEHLVTGAHRALKVLRLHLRNNRQLGHRLIQEARVRTLIRSDHVAEVIDAGVDPRSGMPYIVMELLDGVALSTELRHRGRFSVLEAGDILRQVCHAISAAHDEGIVHLDLKPSNIFLARSGFAGFSFVVKVLDFGIARALVESEPAPVGSALGTPAWMAPEQVDGGGNVSARSDVWAIGLLAYTLLTGMSYWRAQRGSGHTTTRVLDQVMHEPIVPPSQRAAEAGLTGSLPRHFDAWFLRCVNRDVESRFPDAGAAFEALARHLPAPPEELPVRLVPSLGRGPHPEVNTVHAFSSGATHEDTTAVDSPSFRRSRRRRRRRIFWTASLGLGAFAIVGVALALLAASPGAVSSAADTQGSAAAESALPVSSVRTILRLQGSNTIGSELAPALSEAFLRRRWGDVMVTRQSVGREELRVEARSGGPEPYERIEISSHGSATAFVALANHHCDLGMSSRPIQAEEAQRLAHLGDLTAAASEYPFALDGIAVVVNPRNGVTALTRDQLARIFAGEITNWAVVGGVDAPIVVMARDDRSGTFDTFREVVLGARALHAGAVRFEDSAALSDAVAAEPHAIGFIGLAYVRSAKPLMVGDGDALALLPAPVSVASEDYLLARRLYLYVPPGVSGIAKEFVDFALSESGQAVVERVGFVDLIPECDTRAASCQGCRERHRRLVWGACRLSTSFRLDPRTGDFDTRAVRDFGRAAKVVAHPPFVNRQVILLGFADDPAGEYASVGASRVLAERVATQLRARGVAVSAVAGLGRERRLAASGSPGAAWRNQRVELWLR